MTEAKIGKGKLHKRSKTSPTKPDAMGKVVDHEGRPLAVAVWHRVDRPMLISIRPWLDNEKPQEEKRPDCPETKGKLFLNKKKAASGHTSGHPDYMGRVESPYGCAMFVSLWDDGKSYLKVCVKEFEERE